MILGGGCQRVISSMKKRFRITDNGQLYELPGELVITEGRGIARDVGGRFCLTIVDCVCLPTDKQNAVV